MTHVLQVIVNLLSMNLDFSGIEKQPLLESPDLDTRLEDHISLMEMSHHNDASKEYLPNYLN